MRKGLFYRFGECLYAWRWFAILCWVLLFLSCIPFLPRFIEPFKAIGFTDPNSESAKANQILNDKLAFGYNQFIIIYSSDKLRATDPEFAREIKDSLAGLEKISLQHQITYPSVADKQISADKHTAYAIVSLRGGQEVDEKSLKEFKAAVKKPEQLVMKVGGAPIFLDDTKTQTQVDLFKAEYIATPVAILTMLIVFGSVIAAALPVLMGGVCALVILLCLYAVGYYVELSVFTLNIALLLGLCLSLDYALLIINRYRDELEKGVTAKKAVAVTLATSGKAVFFSGLAVFISLSALLLFPINVLFSVGIGGLAAVSVAVAVALIFLPAILCVLDRNINLLPIPFFKPKNVDVKTCWHWLVMFVVKKPWLYFSVILSVLLLLGLPFLKAEFGFSDFRILPKTLESRQVFDRFKAEFGENKLAPIFELITTTDKTPDKNILTPSNLDDLYDYVAKLKSDPRVENVISIVSLDERVLKEDYPTLYADPAHIQYPELKKFLHATTRDNLTVLTIFSKYPGNSPETKALIRQLRASNPGNAMRVDVTGSSVSNMDALHSISQTFPWALLWIIAFTYLVLLVLLRSVFLPLKAIVTAILSLFASYGVLTMVIQFGYLHDLLNIEPQGMLDISLLIIIFCALFGISMDYEVFLLTRIKEYYEQTGNTVKSIVEGIDRSCRIISSAAIIVIFICVSFMSANILIVKAFGLGIAVAVFVDAFLIRTMLVPATMTLMGKWNWYLPKWLGKMLPKIEFDQEG